MNKMILTLMTVAVTTMSFGANAQTMMDATTLDMPTKTEVDATVATSSSEDLSVPVMNKPAAVSVLDTQAVTEVIDNARVDIASDVEVIGAGETATKVVVDAPVADTKTMDINTTVSTNDHPLCMTTHTPRADVDAASNVRVKAPKMIPLSVELADQLSIRGFENIKADGPIGYLTVNDQGQVFFEGQDLSNNVSNLCNSGATIAPVNPNAMKPVMDEKAPDGAAYQDIPGQSSGFKMQPIVDGPSYKTPPKPKKPAPKKVEATVETKVEEKTDVEVESTVQEDVTETVEEVVPMADKVTVDAAIEASEPVDAEAETTSETSVDTSSDGSSIMFDGAVEEVLGTPKSE